MYKSVGAALYGFLFSFFFGLTWVFFSFFLVEPALHVRNGKTVETGKSRITTAMSTLWCTSGFFSWWWWIFC
jgi:hypothetical protein